MHPITSHTVQMVVPFSNIEKNKLTMDSKRPWTWEKGAIFHVCPKCFQQLIMGNKAGAPTSKEGEECMRCDMVFGLSSRLVKLKWKDELINWHLIMISLNNNYDRFIKSLAKCCFDRFRIFKLMQVGKKRAVAKK